ncbi:hypothetical protein ACFLIM_07680 [Nonomuraea sp. M3C6]|uniref:Uncharacterized protein n=1 Tax=Nonomuraea marmarensis TaxID=3351344 RepID=A0ABW7A9N7_9ACTN
MEWFSGRAVPLPIMAGLIVAGLIVAGCGDGGGPRATATVTGSPPTTSLPPPTTITPGPRPRDVLVAGGYQPLWPFSGPEEVAAWQRSYRADGRQAWRLDAARTAIAFTRDYLGFTEIGQAVTTVSQGRHARVHVGFRGEEGPRPLVAAVVHLVRYGSGGDAPWEVVGTDDTSFSLTEPGYGARVGSPVTVGGRISGVDESIRIQVRGPGAAEPLGESCCVGAGGTNTPWSGEVAFTAIPGRTLTIVASTGGHVAAVERFAVTGVAT